MVSALLLFARKCISHTAPRGIWKVGGCDGCAKTSIALRRAWWWSDIIRGVRALLHELDFESNWSHQVFKRRLDQKICICKVTMRASRLRRCDVQLRIEWNYWVSTIYSIMGGARLAGAINFKHEFRLAEIVYCLLLHCFGVGVLKKHYL